MVLAHRSPGGFTLLEVLVVLAIVGLLAAIALPQLQRTAVSVERSSQRTDVKAAIEGVGYQAYVSGKAIVLDGAIAAPGAGMHLPVPTGWQVRFQKPIRYAENGVCSGGKVVISDPEGYREGFMLKPPKCQLEPIEIPE